METKMMALLFSRNKDEIKPVVMEKGGKPQHLGEKTFNSV